MTVNRGEGLNATPSGVERIMITSTRQLAGGTSCHRSACWTSRRRYPPWRDAMPRWLTYFLMTASLTAAVFSKGGVYPREWEWSAMGISLAACLAVFTSSRREGSRRHPWGVALLVLLLGWILLQLVPLPASLVAELSPARWNAVAAARVATGEHGSWLALSVAPAATMERLVDVLPAMAAFVAAREMGWWWSNRIWVTVAPVVAIAWLESILGLIQFYFTRMAGGAAASATGTYVNHNHFAGLMEMGFPLAIMGAVYTWRKGVTRLNQPAGPALRASALLAAAACLLIAIIVSLSRMGFLSTLAAAGLTALSLPASRRVGDFNPQRLVALDHSPCRASVYSAVPIHPGDGFAIRRPGCHRRYLEGYPHGNLERHHTPGQGLQMDRMRFWSL